MSESISQGPGFTGGLGEGPPRAAMLQLRLEGHRAPILAPSLHPALILGKKELTDYQLLFRTLGLIWPRPCEQLGCTDQPQVKGCL